MSRVILIDKIEGKPSMFLGDMEPQPPGPGDVRYRVHAIGLNRSDLMYLEDSHMAPSKLPSRVASEACGIVDAVGEGVTEFAVGDRVSSIPNLDPGYYVGGEFAITPESYLAPWPEQIPATEACAFWMQYITAYFPFYHITRVGRGDTVLIIAAASSAGLGAIHLARLLGAEVIATTRSASKAERLKQQGAHHVIVTGQEPLQERILEITGNRGVNLVYDPVAGSFTSTYVEALAEGAKVFVYGMLGDTRLEYPLIPVVRRNATVQHYVAPAFVSNPTLRAEARLFLSLAQQAGRLPAVVDKVYPLEEMLTAYDYMRTGKQFGKIVLTTKLGNL